MTDTLEQGVIVKSYAHESSIYHKHNLRNNKDRTTRRASNEMVIRPALLALGVAVQCSQLTFRGDDAHGNSIVFGPGGATVTASCPSAQVAGAALKYLNDTAPISMADELHPTSVRAYLSGVAHSCDDLPILMPCVPKRGSSVPPAFFCVWSGKNGNVTSGPHSAVIATEPDEGVYVVCPIPDHLGAGSAMHTACADSGDADFECDLTLDIFHLSPLSLARKLPAPGREYLPSTIKFTSLPFRSQPPPLAPPPAAPPHKTMSWSEVGTHKWTAESSGFVRLLIVAGGGGGGGRSGGGGGGGGLIELPSYAIVRGTEYTIVVGAGGGGGNNPQPCCSSSPGGNGGISSFGVGGTDACSDETLCAVGGGGGGADSRYTGHTGGSGGGGRYGAMGGDALQPHPRGTGLANRYGHGYPGGYGTDGPHGYTNGGGGGAGGPGQDGQSAAQVLANQKELCGVGGPGYASDVSGVVLYYAGGGGGGNYAPACAFGALGGVGGGGGAPDGSACAPGEDGVDGLGGGGGAASDGCGGKDGTNVGGNGGSGIVIASYV